MKAVRIHHTGGPDVLVVEDVETPKPPPGTVLVKVGVSGVNYTDVMARQGIYMSRESGRDLPRTMGTEVAGVVTAVGEGVEPDLVGSRVVAFVEGGYAEYAVADRRLTFRLPESVELGDAVAFLVQGITAWELLVDRARLREGEMVLVHSAAGQVVQPGIPPHGRPLCARHYGNNSEAKRDPAQRGFLIARGDGTGKLNG